MVYLYKNKLPNYGENTHVFFNDANDFVAYLGDAFLQFAEDCYTMNGNIAEVQLPSLIDVDDVTYIVWNTGGAWRFFFVRSAVYQSGFAIFTLDVDLWATHIARASLSNIRVTRCNRNIGTGIYDPIPVAVGYAFEELVENFDIQDLSILFVVAYSTGTTSIFGNNSATKLSVFAKRLSEIDNIPALFNVIDYGIELVGGIYGIEGELSGIEYSLDANVLKAYLVPSNVLIQKETFSPTFKCKSPTFTGDFIPSFEVAPFAMPQAFEIEFDPNKKYYCGTKYAGLELVRTTKPTFVLYRFTVKQDGLQVTVQQGDRMLEITDAFQVGLTSNDGNFTTSQQIARVLQTMSGIAGGVFQISAGGAGYVTGALSIGNALQGAFTEGNARYVQGGDGVTTFRSASGEVLTPFVIQVNESINDEAANARLYGATFNQQVESIDVIFDANLLGTGKLTDTYFAAEVRVDGVPTDARDVIAAAVRGGIYAVKL